MSRTQSKRSAASTMMIWSARDLLRRPQAVILLGSALFLLVTWISTVLLLVHAVEQTSLELLKEGPSLVVRRILPCGWAPMPEKEGLARSGSVPGVVRSRARIWGVVGGPAGPLTVVGLDGRAAEELRRNGWDVFPAPGEALLGPGIGAPDRADSILLQGAFSMRLKVRATLSEETAMALNDIVLLCSEDARSLLGLPEGLASDLAVDVFHEGEEQAILRDLAAAFPWPVRITTRSETAGIYAAGLGRKGGLGLWLAVPSILALAYLIGGAVRDSWGQRREIGLLKALGWTTGDVVRLHLGRALAIGVPATALGLAAGCWLVFWPGVRWPGSLLFGWSGTPPALTLDPSGAVLVLVEVGAMVLVPWVVAAGWSALRAATADPQELIQAGEAFT